MYVYVKNTLLHQKTSGEKQTIAGQKEPNQQTRLGKNRKQHGNNADARYEVYKCFHCYYCNVLQSSAETKFTEGVTV